VPLVVYQVSSPMLNHHWIEMTYGLLETLAAAGAGGLGLSPQTLMAGSRP
jgi:hypothetical protein